MCADKPKEQKDSELGFQVEGERRERTWFCVLPPRPASCPTCSPGLSPMPDGCGVCAQTKQTKACGGNVCVLGPFSQDLFSVPRPGSLHPWRSTFSPGLSAVPTQNQSSVGGGWGDQERPLFLPFHSQINVMITSFRSLGRGGGCTAM